MKNIKINFRFAFLLFLPAIIMSFDACDLKSKTVAAEDKISGNYYDWTKTLEPEQPWVHDYNKTLFIKLFLCSRDSLGNVDSVYLKFADIPEVLRKIDNVTIGIPKIVYLVGWQYNGHDSKYPSWEQVNEQLKRDQDSTSLQSLKWVIREAKKHNAVVSLHINMIDAFKDSPLWREYLEKDIVAKDKSGNPIPGEIHSGMQSYQISYAQEWNLGYAQRRIDKLVEMLPELKEAGTIHIDAFHSMRPSGPGEQISPYLGISVEDEISAQRKIFRYWRKFGVDVTSEGAKYQLRKDPFLGLQAATWWFDENNFAREEWPNKPRDFTSLPSTLSCYSPMHCEEEVKMDPANLTGLAQQTCLNLAPWYYRRNVDVSMKETIILTDDEVICPVLWKDRAMVAFNSETGIKDKKIKLPTTWVDTKAVQLYDLTIEGLKPRKILNITDGIISLSINKNEPTVIMPLGQQ